VHDFNGGVVNKILSFY